jgi:hypothetical protein
MSNWFRFLYSIGGIVFSLSIAMRVPGVDIVYADGLGMGAYLIGLLLMFLPEISNWLVNGLRDDCSHAPRGRG